MVGNRIYCPECFHRLWPDGHEEKTCTHGMFVASCVGCGNTRDLDEKPYWHCLGTMSLPTFSLVINHSPWRPERVSALYQMLVDLGPTGPSGDPERVRMVNDKDYRGRDWREAKVDWMLAQWDWSMFQPTSHHVFMTDDLHIAPGFWEILRAMVFATGDAPAIGLLSNHPQGPELAAQQHRWYKTRSWLVGPAYVLSHKALVDLLAWRAQDPSRHMPGWDEPFNDDECINAWLCATGQDCLHPLPTIIEHRHDLESVLGHGDQYSRDRVSWRAIRTIERPTGGEWLWRSTPAAFDLEAMKRENYWRMRRPVTIPRLALP